MHCLYDDRDHRLHRLRPSAIAGACAGRCRSRRRHAPDPRQMHGPHRSARSPCAGEQRWSNFRVLRAEGLPLFLQHEQGRHFGRGLLLSLELLLESPDLPLVLDAELRQLLLLFTARRSRRAASTRSRLASLASWAACRQRSTCYGYRPRSLQ